MSTPVPAPAARLAPLAFALAAAAVAVLMLAPIGKLIDGGTSLPPSRGAAPMRPTVPVAPVASPEEWPGASLPDRPEWHDEVQREVWRHHGVG